MIKINNVSKNFKDKNVLSNISFEIKRGSSIGIIGKNGAGKTTLINTILGSIKPTSGSVSYSFPKKDMPKIVGVQMQDGYFENLLKVKEVCYLFCDLYNIHRSKAKKLLSEFEIDNVRNSSLSKLSGGERQKVNILLSIIHDPEFLFFDEITTGLDAFSRDKIYKTISELKKKNKTIVLVSHYFEEIWNLCDSILVLDSGNTLYYGETKNVASNFDDFNKNIIKMIGGER